jgi:hypothetical protein
MNWKDLKGSGCGLFKVLYSLPGRNDKNHRKDLTQKEASENRTRNLPNTKQEC